MPGGIIKKVNWGLFVTGTNELTKDLHVDWFNPHIVLKLWTNSIIKAIKETRPRGVMASYKSYWDEKLHNFKKMSILQEMRLKMIKSIKKHIYYQK